MKYKREWCFGGDAKNPAYEDDFITRYIAENDVCIDCDYGICGTHYEVGGRYYDTLNAAKAAVEIEAELKTDSQYREIIKAHGAEVLQSYKMDRLGVGRGYIIKYGGDVFDIREYRSNYYIYWCGIEPDYLLSDEKCRWRRALLEDIANAHIVDYNRR